MSWKSWFVVGVIGVTVGWVSVTQAKDLKITLPKHSRLTPVQRLNQEGVEEIRKHAYEKAETLFYKAYLLDPDDPFTLNNLGYVSELQGQVDRALRFYDLAGQQATDAVIDRSSARRLEGQPMKAALAVSDLPLQINHDNVEAVRMLSQGRAPEADLFLQHVLQKNPNDVFTLNNMGVAKEMEGESQEALRYFDQAASIHSDAVAAVTLSRSWRGKPVTELAAQNAKNLRDRMEKASGTENTVADLNIRGVSALNRNDLSTADRDFRKAYELDPNNAFAINNVGYLAEMEGDQESAEFFYEKAESAGDANRTVGLATRLSAEGSKLGQVASESDAKVGTVVAQERNERRQHQEPILLRRRDNSVVQEPMPAPAGNLSPQQNSQ
jgi:Flp pilus assembly protein TadD